MLLRLLTACGVLLLTGAAPAARLGDAGPGPGPLLGEAARAPSFDDTPGAPSFGDAVASAWARDPSRAGLEAQREAAVARGRAAQSFFPDSPTVSGTYDDDHALGSNEGYTTYQAELSTPIWLPGEGTATERVARADAATADARIANAKLTLAAEVLDAAAAASLARQEEAVAQGRLRVARRIADVVGHAARLGELPSTDRDQAQADLDQAVAAEASAAMRQTNARAVLSSLTGSDAVPRLAEAPAVEEAATGIADDATAGAAEDPRLLVFERKLDAARQQLRLVRNSPIADPEIGLEGIRDKQFGSPWDSRVGVVVRIPLPSRARNLPRLAAAASAVAVADGELVLARRQVQLGIVQANVALHGAQNVQRAMVRVADALDRRAQALERAWRAGETPLIELLRAEQAATEADLQEARDDVMAQAAALRAVLAGGMVPQ